MFTIRSIASEECDRVREIDVSETDDLVYMWRDGALVETQQHWERPQWGPMRCEEIAADWRDTLGQGGTVLGAFDGDQLVAEAVLVPHLTATTAQLQYLHVSRAYRRQGIASRLVMEISRLARETGARQLYVSATPSRSAVGFYRTLGFAPTSTPHPDLFVLEPDDIHMTISL